MFLAVWWHAYRSLDGRAWTKVSDGAPGAYTIVYGDGVWLATTSGNGAWASTDDGETWTRASDVGGYWSDVSWAGDQFVTAVAGQIGQSTDGFTWTWRLLAPGSFRVRYSGGRWWVDSDDGFLTSTTGETWVLTSGTAAYDGLPVFANGRWVCAMWSGRMRYSDDGISFTTVAGSPIPGTNDAFDAFGDRVVVGAADGLYASSTMVLWTRVSALAGAYEVVGGPGGWMATGSDPQWWFATSPDGLAWTTRWTAEGGGVFPASPDPVQLRGRTGRRLFVFAGDSAMRDLYTSTNLNTWHAASGWEPTTEPPPIAWDGADAPGGLWRLRQHQTLAGADGWPLRQRQNGGHSGSWPLRQHQSGV